MKKKRQGVDILIRYLILIIVAVPNLWLFYMIFTPLTVFPVYWILSLFFDVYALSSNVLVINNLIPIELINACIAGSAYYLLLILNLSTPKIKIKTRVKAILFSFMVFWLINILRIVILSAMAVSSSPLFDVTHIFLWYGISIILVVGIWFTEVKMFKIKQIPFYSDLKHLFKKIK